jgi:hypothetical protein
MQLIDRLVIGALIISLFAVIGHVLKPKSFAGLFGAPPSVAVAALGLTILADGKPYAALEALSMIAHGNKDRHRPMVVESNAYRL